MTPVTLTFALSDEVALADLSTFLLRVVEKEEDLYVFGELVVYLVHYEVEVMVVDRRAPRRSSLKGTRLDNANLKLRLTVLVLWGAWSGRKIAEKGVKLTNCLKI